MPGQLSRIRPARAAAVTTLVIAVLGVAAPAGAQTTTTTVTAPVTTTTPTAVTTTSAALTTTLPRTTVPVATTLAPATTVPTVPSTEAPLVAKKDTSSDGSVPWLPIIAVIVVLTAIIVLMTMWARRRGGRARALDDWRDKAAGTTAEAGATARLLSTGAPVSRQIAQQVLTSIRGFEDLAVSAPDDEHRAAAERGRRALQSLGLVIDSDHQLRRAQPPASPDRLDASAAALRNAATDTDRALRRLYRGFTDAG